jgi:hypothetical protein
MDRRESEGYRRRMVAPDGGPEPENDDRTA